MEQLGIADLRPHTRAFLQLCTDAYLRPRDLYPLNVGSVWNGSPREELVLQPLPKRKVRIRKLSLVAKAAIEALVRHLGECGLSQEADAPLFQTATGTRCTEVEITNLGYKCYEELYQQIYPPTTDEEMERIVARDATSGIRGMSKWGELAEPGRPVSRGSYGQGPGGRWFVFK